jgi:hypothetical protein
MAEQDFLLNGSLINNLPAQPVTTPAQENLNDNTSYQDILRSIQTSIKNVMKSDDKIVENIPTRFASPTTPVQTSALQMPLPAPQTEPMYASPPTQDTFQQSFQQQAPTFPQQQIQNTPLMSNLLPDPIMYNPPVQPQIPHETMLKRSEIRDALKDIKRTSKFDMGKIKPALLVVVVVFVLLTWGVPVIARRLDWSVDPISGKFTTYGLLLISVLTGGSFLGLSELMNKFS